MVDVLDILQNGYNNAVSNVSSVVDNLSVSQVALGAATAGALVSGGVVAAVVGTKRKKYKKKKKKAKKRTAKKKRKLKFGSKAFRKKYLKKGRRKHRQKKPHTAGKRQDTSHRRIRYTKNNQPYVIMSNGRARFIKRSSARRSKKMKGGRY